MFTATVRVFPAASSNLQAPIWMNAPLRLRIATDHVPSGFLAVVDRMVCGRSKLKCMSAVGCGGLSEDRLKTEPI